MPDNNVITFSRKGYPKKDHKRNKYSFEDSLISKDILVLGYSWGNVPALEYTAKNSKHIKGLILVSPYLYPGKSALKRILVSFPFFSHVIFTLFGKSIVRNILRKSSCPLSVPTNYQKLAKNLSDSQVLIAALKEKEQNYITDNVLNKINESKIPVALIWGDKDLTSNENEQIFPIRRIIHPLFEKRLQNAGHAILHTNAKDLANFIQNFIISTSKGRDS